MMRPVYVDRVAPQTRDALSMLLFSCALALVCGVSNRRF